MRRMWGLIWLALCVASPVTAAPITPPAAGAQFRDCRDCPDMIVIPAGNFVMGSPKAEAGRFENEGPTHEVTIARPFALGIHDVTVAEYRRFVHATGRKPVADCRIHDPAFVEPQLVRVKGKNWLKPGFTQRADHPVVCVSWDDAQAYIDWLNGHEGVNGYRLPTEAEWEYAARGRTVTPFSWGEAIARDRANYGPDEPRFAAVALRADRWRFTSPVGAFPPNPFGLHDMAGNVWQFTEDCWFDSYVGAPADGSARTGGKCDERVVRGGSWFKPPAGERSAKRGEGKVVDLKGNAEIGFRLARDLEVPQGTEAGEK